MNFHLKPNQLFKSGLSVASERLYFAQYTLLSMDALNVQLVHATKNYLVLNVFIHQEFKESSIRKHKENISYQAASLLKW